MQAPPDLVRQRGGLMLVTDSLKEEFECVICYEPMLDPVTFECGHSLCRHCAIDHLESIRGRPRCAVGCRLSTLAIRVVRSHLGHRVHE